MENVATPLLLTFVGPATVVPAHVAPSTSVTAPVVTAVPEL
jgi:hypothetical protein